jgi:hypothetical protein
VDVKDIVMEDWRIKTKEEQERETRQKEKKIKTQQSTLKEKTSLTHNKHLLLMI